MAKVKLFFCWSFLREVQKALASGFNGTIVAGDMTLNSYPLKFGF